MACKNLSKNILLTQGTKNENKETCLCTLLTQQHINTTRIGNTHKWTGNYLYYSLQDSLHRVCITNGLRGRKYLKSSKLFDQCKDNIKHHISQAPILWPEISLDLQLKHTKAYLPQQDRYENIV